MGSLGYGYASVILNLSGAVATYAWTKQDATWCYYQLACPVGTTPTCSQGAAFTWPVGTGCAMPYWVWGYYRYSDPVTGALIRCIFGDHVTEHEPYPCS